MSVDVPGIVRCGHNILGLKVGCSRPMLSEEAYRCIDCDVPFHKHCLHRHCEDGWREAELRGFRLGLLAAGEVRCECGWGPSADPRDHGDRCPLPVRDPIVTLQAWLRFVAC